METFSKCSFFVCRQAVVHLIFLAVYFAKPWSDTRNNVFSKLEEFFFVYSILEYCKFSKKIPICEDLYRIFQNTLCIQTDRCSTFYFAKFRRGKTCKSCSDKKCKTMFSQNSKNCVLVYVILEFLQFFDKIRSVKTFMS